MFLISTNSLIKIASIVRLHLALKGGAITRYHILCKEGSNMPLGSSLTFEYIRMHIALIQSFVTVQPLTRGHSV